MKKVIARFKPFKPVTGFYAIVSTKDNRPFGDYYGPDMFARKEAAVAVAMMFTSDYRIARVRITEAKE